MAKSTKKIKKTTKEKSKSKKPKGKKSLGKYLTYSEATSLRAAYEQSVAPIIYKSFVTYTIDELRNFIDAAEIELLNHDPEKANHGIALFPVIEINKDNRMSVGLTSCLIVKNDTTNGIFKNQFNTQLIGGAIDPLNPFNGNGADLDAYNHGQGHP